MTKDDNRLLDESTKAYESLVGMTDSSKRAAIMNMFAISKQTLAITLQTEAIKEQTEVMRNIHGILKHRM